MSHTIVVSGEARAQLDDLYDYIAGPALRGSKPCGTTCIALSAVCHLHQTPHP